MAALEGRRLWLFPRYSAAGSRWLLRRTLRREISQRGNEAAQPLFMLAIYTSRSCSATSSARAGREWKQVNHAVVVLFLGKIPTFVKSIGRSAGAGSSRTPLSALRPAAMLPLVGKPWSIAFFYDDHLPDLVSRSSTSPYATSSASPMALFADRARNSAASFLGAHRDNSRSQPVVFALMFPSPIFLSDGERTADAGGRQSAQPAADSIRSPRCAAAAVRQPFHARRPTHCAAGLLLRSARLPQGNLIAYAGLRDVV